MIIEPILGEGGFLTPPPGFLAALRALCDKHGMLLIFDEARSAGLANSQTVQSICCTAYKNTIPPLFWGGWPAFGSPVHAARALQPPGKDSVQLASA